MRHGIVSNEYMSSSGQFHVDRGIFYDWTAEDRPWCSLALWLYIISRGQYKDTTVTYLGHQFSLSRGQLVTSASHLCKVAGWTRQRLRTFLLRCVKDGKITMTGGKKGTVLTILNYDKWQSPHFNLERVFDEQPTLQPTLQPSSSKSTTGDMPHEQPTLQPTLQPQSIYSDQYQQCSVSTSTKDKEGGLPQKSKGKGKTPVIIWDALSLQFSGIDDNARARLALAYPKADVDRCIEVMRSWLIKRGDNPHKSYWKSLCSIAEDPQNQKKGLGIEQDFYGQKYRISYDSQSEPLFEAPKKRKHPDIPAAIQGALAKVSGDDD